MKVSAQAPFDGTLNTIGHITAWTEGEILPDMPDTCGHGYGDEYRVHLPQRRYAFYDE